MRDEGLKIPEKNRKRLLSKSWIEPISYKTFSNLLDRSEHSEDGQTKYGQMLLDRNGPDDMLRRTLIVIDEAHKLYGGDLKWAERPNMNTMERLLRNSYKKSGKDSARLLIMTATPFTDSPMELFKLINLCKENPDEHITTDVKKFKDTYMSADDQITNAGSKKLADSLSGYISYLNREQDPTQFAQPIMIEVPAIMSHIEDPELRPLLYSDKEDKKEHKEQDKMKKKREDEERKLNKERIRTTLKTMKVRIQETKKDSKVTQKNRQTTECKQFKNKAEKDACNKRIKDAEEAELKRKLDAIQDEIDKLKKELEDANVKQPKVNMRGKIKELRERMLQEVMLVKRCKSIVMAKGGPRATKKNYKAIKM